MLPCAALGCCGSGSVRGWGAEEPPPERGVMVLVPWHVSANPGCRALATQGVGAAARCKSVSARLAARSLLGVDLSLMVFWVLVVGLGLFSSLAGG